MRQVGQATERVRERCIGRVGGTGDSLFEHLHHAGSRIVGRTREQAVLGIGQKQAKELSQYLTVWSEHAEGRVEGKQHPGKPRAVGHRLCLPGVGKRELIVELERHCFLTWKVMVDVAHADAGLVGNLAQGGRTVTGFGDERGRNLEEALAHGKAVGAGALRTPTGPHLGLFLWLFHRVWSQFDNLTERVQYKYMKIIIAGGTGQIGRAFAAHRSSRGDEVMLLSRAEGRGRRAWDGRTLGPWVRELEGADVVLNLAGRSVDCRYTKHNLAEMFASRIDSTEVIGAAIASCARPPAVWLQMSTATIYAHRTDAANDETTGILGGHEPDAPGYWRGSIEIAKAWERAAQDAPTPHTRKVILRTAMVMGPSKGGVFDTLLSLTRRGLGGTMAGGKQYMSFIHEQDFCRALDFLIERPDLSGVFNLASPHPLPQAGFARELRKASGTSVGLPAAAWMLKLGAFLLRTDAELVLKSRRVVPDRLLRSGFEFQFADWSDAAKDLLARVRDARSGRAKLQLAAPTS